MTKPEEEELLLPNSRNSKGANGKLPPKAAPTKAGMCKLPWFGSWSVTFLIWLVTGNLAMLWSLPSPTFAGKLTVVRRLWSVNQIFQEDEDLKNQLKKQEDKNAELQKGVGSLQDMKQKAALGETETLRLQAQLKDVQSQLDKQRDETRKQREEAAELRRKKEQAEGELRRLRTQMADSSKITAELTRGKDVAEKNHETERRRADRLASKLKQLRDDEARIFKEEEQDLS